MNDPALAISRGSATFAPMNARPARLAFLFALSASLLSGATFTDDFSTDPAARFVNPSGGRQPFVHNAAEGEVRLSPGNRTSAMALRQSVGSFAQAGTFVLAIDFLPAQARSGRTNNIAALGLATRADQFYGERFEGFELTVRALDGQDPRRAALRFRIDGEKEGEIFSQEILLQSEVWHRMTFTLTATPERDVFQVTARLFQRDRPGQAIASIAPSLVRRSLAHDAALFAGFAGTANATGSGALAFDHFLVATEDDAALY
jgi:hypothetical protein